MTDYKLTQKSIVDELAQFIRQVDGNNKMGAGSLADKICERFRVDAPVVQAEPVACEVVGRAYHESFGSGVRLKLYIDAHQWPITEAIPIGTKLYFRPHPEGQQPAPDTHWAVKNPGKADQYRREAEAARVSLGFSADSDDVSPREITDSIQALVEILTTIRAMFPIKIDEHAFVVNGEQLLCVNDDDKFYGTKKVNALVDAIVNTVDRALAAHRKGDQP